MTGDRIADRPGLENASCANPHEVPVAVSARHVHLSPFTARRLFGEHHRLVATKSLTQPGQWVGSERVDVVGPHGTLHDVAVIGPCRAHDQIELSRSDAIAIGVDPPVRLSGSLANTPKVVLRWRSAQVKTDGTIVAMRHLHTNPGDARHLGVAADARLRVALRGTDRPLVFEDVVVRVDPSFRTELHIDTDEANAAGIESPGQGRVPSHITASIEAVVRHHSAEVTR